MRIPPSLLLGLGRFLLFILLEAACIYMVSHNGIVQRYRLIGQLRQVQGFFWEKYASIREYSSLRVYFENMEKQIRRFSLTGPRLGVYRLHCLLQDREDTPDLLEQLGIPENATFTVRFLSDLPIVVSHPNHAPVYHSSII